MLTFFQNKTLLFLLFSSIHDGTPSSLLDHLTFKEVQEERPVGSCFMTAMVLTIGEATFHQTIVHTRKEVCTDTLIAEQFIHGRCL